MQTPISASRTIALIDDHEAIHAGVEAWCARADPPVLVAGTFTMLDDFLAHDTASTLADVVVLDLELRSRRPDFSALERLAQAGHRVVVYSHLLQHEVILRCLDAGATTYITKAEGKEHLLEAIHLAAGDASHVGPAMAGALFSDQTPGRPKLTKREAEVLIAWFRTENKELVGRQLFISTSSVRTILQRVRAKYAAVGRPAATKAALVARAVQDGIISIEEL